MKKKKKKNENYLSEVSGASGQAGTRKTGSTKVGMAVGMEAVLGGIKKGEFLFWLCNPIIRLDLQPLLHLQYNKKKTQKHIATVSYLLANFMVVKYPIHMGH